MSDTIVIMKVRLGKDIATTDWLKANEQINEWRKQQQGFRFQSLSETADGEWYIVVYWASLEAAKAAGEKFREKLEGLIVPFVEMKSFSSSYSTAHLMQQG
jgi:hypothetical protein